MGDRAWHEAWIYGEDLLKYAAAIELAGSHAFDGDAKMWLKDWLEAVGGYIAPEEINRRFIGAETFDQCENGWHIMLPDINGGGYSYAECAAELGVRFHGATGAGYEFTGVQFWSDGGGKLHEWTADSQGQGLLLRESVVSNESADIHVSDEVGDDGGPMIVWREGLLGEIRAFLIGMKMMMELVGEDLWRKNGSSTSSDANETTPSTPA